MGLLDKVKGAVAKGIDMAGKAVADIQAAQELAAKEDAEKKAAAEQAEVDRINAIKQKEIEQALATNCDKGMGDCLWFENMHKKKFYFTCPDDCECERKKYTQKSWDQLFMPEFWPYMKRWVYEGYDSSIRKSDDYLYNVSTAIKDEIAEDMLKEFLPDYLNYEYPNDVIKNFSYLLNLHGFGKNDYMQLVFDMYGKLDSSMPFLLHVSHGLNISEPSHPIYRNPSLYKEDSGDTGFILKVVSSIIFNQKYNEDFPAEVSLDCLLDSDGNVLPAGYGGPEKGHYGDSVWNVVADWEDKGYFENPILDR